jgi:hypothetical protein
MPVVLFVSLLLSGILAALPSKAAVGEGSCFQSMQTSTFPGNMFLNTTDTLSTQWASTTQNCGNQFPECFQTNNIPYVTNPGFLVSSNSVCRVLLEYKTPATPFSGLVNAGSNSTGTSESKCTLPDPSDQGSVDAQECNCQMLAAPASTSSNITFQFQMSEAQCCPRCTCSGDVSFPRRLRPAEMSTN